MDLQVDISIEGKVLLIRVLKESRSPIWQRHSDAARLIVAKLLHDVLAY